MEWVGIPKGEGRGESGGSLGCNPSALVPWERRVRPAPYVKNSGEAGATASSGCWGVGVSRLRGPSFGDRTGSWREAGKGPTGPGAHVPFLESESELPPPRVLGASPLIPGGLLVQPTRLSNPPGPRPEDPYPGTWVRGLPRPYLRRRASPRPPPPSQTPGELRSNLTKLAAGCAGLYLAWGGVQGPRLPQLPGAAGCTTASARSPSGRSRPAAGAGGGAATPPRPAPPRQGSPGVPAPRPPPPNDFSTFRRAQLTHCCKAFSWGGGGSVGLGGEREERRDF